MKKKLLCILFVLTVLLGTILMFTIGSSADTAQNVKYLDSKGAVQNCATATVVTDSSEEVTWAAGWYVVTGENVNIAKTVTCSGEVHLILCDGASLTVTAETGTQKAGINVTGSNSLTIYAGNSSETIAGTGKLFATGKEYSDEGGAGIGGNRFQDGKNITINGGKITAKGANCGAGLGGGLLGNGSNITINGGKVTATGGDGAAGIGGGANKTGSNITINGGDVTANGGWSAEAIGKGGWSSAASNIKVSAMLEIKAGANSESAVNVVHESSDDLAAINGFLQRYVKIAPHTHCVCGSTDCSGTGHNNTQVWTPWNEASSLPATAGYYCLATDVTLSDTWSPATGTYLCLNGHVISLDDSLEGKCSVINVDTSTSLTVTDCQDTAHYFTVQESGQWQLNDTQNSANYTFDASNGLKTTAGAATTDIPASGKVIKVSGGIITGGTGSPNWTHGSGGAILNRGSLTLYRGNIVGNRCDHSGGGIYNYEGTVIMNGGTVAGNWGRYGAGVQNRKDFTMNGGIIGYNNAKFTNDPGTDSDGYGGGILTQKNGHFILKDGFIIGNRAVSKGGGVSLSDNGIFTMEGGNVCYNVASEDGGGISMQKWDSNMTVKISGGYIYGNKCDIGGGISFYGEHYSSDPDSSSLTIGGTVKVTGNTTTDGTKPSNLYVYNQLRYITIGTGTNGVPAPVAKNDNNPEAPYMLVGVSAYTTPGKFTTNASSGDEDFFTSDSTSFSVAYNSGSGSGAYLKLVEPCCYIDKNGNGAFDDQTEKKYVSIKLALAELAPTDESAAKPTVISLITDDEENVTVPTGRNIILDLNGYVLKGTGTGSVITNNGTLTIKDSNNTNVHYFEVGDNGLWTWDSTINSGEKYTFDKENGLRLNGSATDNIPAKTEIIKVSGGCITGGKLYPNGNGGGINSEVGTLIFIGGNVVGNQANAGAGLNGANIDLKLNGGCVVGNYATTNFGGIRMDSSTKTVNILDGRISYNKAATDCGGVGNRFNISGGEISYNTAGRNGGGIQVGTGSNGKMTGGIIKNNVASSAGGGLYLWNSSASFTATGGKITGNMAASKAGIGCNSDSDTITLGGDVVIRGNTLFDNITASNLYLLNNQKITIGTGDDAPKSNMQVGVTMYSSSGAFTKNGTASDVSKFTSDNLAYKVKYVEATAEPAVAAHLELGKYTITALTSNTAGIMLEKSDMTEAQAKAIMAVDGAHTNGIVVYAVSSGNYSYLENKSSVWGEASSTKTLEGLKTAGTVYVIGEITEKEVLTISVDTTNSLDLAWTGNAYVESNLPVSAAKSDQTAVTGLTYTYTWYKADETSNPISGAPKDVGAYKVKVSIASSDNDYTGESRLVDVNIIPVAINEEHEVIDSTTNYQIGSDGSIVFISSADYKDFVSVTVSKDGGAATQLSEVTDYTKTSGSIKITLTDDYVSKMTEGTYEFSINSILPNTGNKVVETKFTVVAKENSCFWSKIIAGIKKIVGSKLFKAVLATTLVTELVKWGSYYISLYAS